jgi:ELWxxDGT repeat protein
LTDLAPGAGSSFPLDFTRFGGFLYFAATDGINGLELWRTDATPQGTEMVADLNPGPADSLPRNFMVVGEYLYFSASDGVYGRELWRTDGSPDGTVMISDIAAGSSDSNPVPVAEYQGRLLFRANDGLHGSEFWITEGNAGDAFSLAHSAGVTATVSWLPVTQSDDGLPLTNLAGYRIYFGTSPYDLSERVEVRDPAATTMAINFLPSGERYFAMTAFTTDGRESDRTAVTGKVFLAPP